MVLLVQYIPHAHSAQLRLSSKYHSLICFFNKYIGSLDQITPEVLDYFDILEYHFFVNEYLVHVTEACYFTRIFVVSNIHHFDNSVAQPVTDDANISPEFAPVVTDIVNVATFEVVLLVLGV